MDSVAKFEKAYKCREMREDIYAMTINCCSLLYTEKRESELKTSSLFI
ncbi:hypothetical protein IKE_05805 [Bacillus cereus VD196]|uniref:Uncharacterized protein n=1 Tax=Bacillus cereus VD196 TaxID=1053243 RepID=A0A9W5V612_BACCE|nr:hypothetical protein IKG_05643 [Bacillus cereus VD200]EOO62015.1 hypothetical protein IKE_05805 [Bacillus cereus VD196]